MMQGREVCKSDRRSFLKRLGLGSVGLALDGCRLPRFGGPNGRIALELCSINGYIRDLGNNRDALARALEEVAKIGYTGVEFAGHYYGCTGAELKKLLDDNGLVACSVHDGNSWKFHPRNIRKLLDFQLSYGNRLVIAPRSDMPGKGERLVDFMPRICDAFNTAAETAKAYGCRIGLHNHEDEFKVKLPDGTTYWDYFFAHTSTDVVMQIDLGWATRQRQSPAALWEKFPHRSPVLHAKENGSAILGRSRSADAVDWDAALVAAERNGVAWWIVENDSHQQDLSVVTPDYAFLRSKGLS